IAGATYASKPRVASRERSSSASARLRKALTCTVHASGFDVEAAAVTWVGAGRAGGAAAAFADRAGRETGGTSAAFRALAADGGGAGAGSGDSGAVSTAPVVVESSLGISRSSIVGFPTWGRSCVGAVSVR